MTDEDGSGGVEGGRGERIGWEREGDHNRTSYSNLNHKERWKGGESLHYIHNKPSFINGQINEGTDISIFQMRRSGGGDRTRNQIDH